MGKNLFDILNWAGPAGNIPASEPDSPGYETGNTASKKELSNQDILEYVTEHFKTKMLNKSLQYAVMFPMSFTVILNKSDYDEFKGYCPIVSKYIVLSFYEIIRKALDEDKKKVCEKPGKYWNISFLQCDDEPMNVNDKIIQVNKGECYIFSTSHDKLIEQIENSGSGGSTITVSKGGSLYAAMNMNRETWDNLRLIGETHLQFDWDPTMKSVNSYNYSDTSTNEMAVARIRTQGKEFRIVNGTYTISGNKETRMERNIFKVDSDFVENGHVQIEYVKTDDKFKIVAFHDYVMLNDEPLTVSTTNDKIYVDLEDGDEISIYNNEVVMKFNTIK